MVLAFSTVIPHIINQIAEMGLTGNEDSLQFDDFLTTEQVIIEEIIDETNPSKNTCFSVRTIDGKLSFFLKQPKVLTPKAKFSLFKEKTFYEVVFWMDAKIWPAFTNIQKFLPNYYHYDSNYAIEILRFLNETNNLNEYLNNNGHIVKSDLYEAIGSTLREMHDTLVNFDKFQPQFQLFDKTYPSEIFLLDPSKFKFQKQIYPQLAKYATLAQNNNFSVDLEIVQKAIELWNNSENQTLIHGDFKLKNILINDKKKCYIIDWENAIWGDREWDIANFYYSLVLNRASIHDWHNTMSGIKRDYDAFLNGYGNDISMQKVYTYLCLRIVDYCATNPYENAFKNLLHDLTISD